MVSSGRFAVFIDSKKSFYTSPDRAGNIERLLNAAGLAGNAGIKHQNNRPAGLTLSDNNVLNDITKCHWIVSILKTAWTKNLSSGGAQYPVLKSESVFMALKIWDKFISFGTGFNICFKQWRRPFTTPICAFLIKMHINQTHVSLFRIPVLAVFILLWMDFNYTGALITLSAFFILDWIDGDLSRSLKHEGDLGKFEDLTVDNLMVVSFPFLLIWQNLVPGLLGALYIFLVTQSWWFSVIRRNSGWKSDWLFRSLASPFLHILRFWVVTILMILYALWRLDWFTTALWILSILMAFNVIWDYYQIIKNRLYNRK